MNLIPTSKTKVHFLYQNGFVEHVNLVKESDKTLTCKGRTMVKDTKHAFIDEKGTKHYYVNGSSAKTSKPYTKANNTDEIDRETIHAVFRTNLLKNIAQAQLANTFITIMIFIAGAGVGYVLGVEYGADTTNYNNQSYDQHYHQDTPQQNGTIVISTITFMEVKESQKTLQIIMDSLNPL